MMGTNCSRMRAIASALTICDALSSEKFKNLRGRISSSIGHGTSHREFMARSEAFCSGMTMRVVNARWDPAECFDMLGVPSCLSVVCILINYKPIGIFPHFHGKIILGS